MSNFFVTGGTLRPDAPSYVERRADKDLHEGLLHGEFCYVLTSRQMGKSSLMVRTVRKLRAAGVRVVVLDLTAIGQNLSVEQWYDGMLARIGQQLDLEDDLEAFWTAQPSQSPLQRWTLALEKVVLPRCPHNLVIFIDEIDIVRSLPFSTDEFFAAIRELYNRRSQDPAFSRLSFGLLGVATPNDLIRDTRMTPFNIGRRIELNDFTEAEAMVLAPGLNPEEKVARCLLQRILYWTGGHPYLTQRLCQSLVDHARESQSPTGAPLPPVIPTTATVDELADRLFLSRQARDRDDNLVFVRERLLRSEADVAGLLYLYRRVRLGEKVPDDETNPLGSILHLSGITLGTNGFLRVRNRIYFHVFDLGWIKTNMPGAEVRRQRVASRKGTIRGVALAVALFMAYLIVSPWVIQYRETQLITRTLDRLFSNYRNLAGYQAAFDVKIELESKGMVIPLSGAGTFEYRRPNQLQFALTSSFATPNFELNGGHDGRRSWLYLPSTKESREDSGRGPPRFLMDTNLVQQVGPVMLFPIYRLWLRNNATERFHDETTNLVFSGQGKIDDEAVYILSWEHDAFPLLAPLGFFGRPDFGGPGGRGPAGPGRDGPGGDGPGPGGPEMGGPEPGGLEPPRIRIPVTAWIGKNSGLVRQIRLDLTPWIKNFVRPSPALDASQLLVTETHKNLRLDQRSNARTPRAIGPPRDSVPVLQFNLPEPTMERALAVKKHLSMLIPNRHPLTPASLIDLGEFFNASLQQAWHPGNQDNNLSALPAGLLNFGGTLFDVRGVVQLSGRSLAAAGKRFPEKIVGIKIGQKTPRLYFVHATGWRVANGTRIGWFIVHFASGQTREIPIDYGEDVRDWNLSNDPSKTVHRSVEAWNNSNSGRVNVRLFKSQWDNPTTGDEIASLDYVSAMTDCAPFLLAITVE